jgi:Ca2+/Na+ antiporter
MGSVSRNLNKKIGRSRTRRPSTATTVLVASATAIVVCSFYFIDNLDAAVEGIYVSQTFIAMIIIPIASNAPKASTLITALQKKRINDAIGVIVGGILQIALFVLQPWSSSARLYAKRRRFISQHLRLLLLNNSVSSCFIQYIIKIAMLHRVVRTVLETANNRTTAANLLCGFEDITF